MAFVAPLAASVGTFLTSTAGAATIAAAGAGLAAVSSISQGNYQAAVARNNAAIAEQNAARLSEASQKEAQRSDTNYAVLLAEQLAAQGASGFDILGRSQTQARMLTRRTGRQEAEDIWSQGETGARQALQEAANLRGEARQAKMQGYLSAAGSLLNAGGDILNTRGSLISKGRRKMPWDRKPDSWYGVGQ